MPNWGDQSVAPDEQKAELCQVQSCEIENRDRVPLTK